MPALQGKVAIVTGAGRGIGRGMAEALAREGASVLVASRSQGGIDEAVDSIRTAGGTAEGLSLDVGNESEVRAMVGAAVDRFGRLDILINNAQSFGAASGSEITQDYVAIEDVTNDQWDNTIRTGLTASLWAMQEALPHLRERGGRIINMASAAGIIGQPGMLPYNCAKEALRSLTRTAAREWGRYGITVNVVCPLVKTRALAEWTRISPDQSDALLAEVPLGRFGTLEDAGDLAVFLASDASKYMTGMTFMLDGGSTMLT